MSPGWAMRFNGMARARESYSFWLACATWSSSEVSVGPGQTQFTVTPAAATSRASALVNAITPPLVAEYTASPDEPTFPASEPRLTTRPPPRATMSRTTRWHVVIGPRRLTSMMRPHVAGSLSRNGPITSMPALLTRMSIGPSSASVRCTAAWTLGASVTSTRMPAAEGACLPATATARSSSRSHTATAAPAAASAPTIASPIPRPPPVTTATRPCSAICPPLLARRPAEVRRPLLTVRRQALCGVRTSEPEELIGERRVERRRHDAVPVVERVLGPPQRALCAGGERHRHLERLGPHLVVLDAQRHQPDALGL